MGTARVASLCILFSAACGSESPPELRAFYGEVHLHGFAAGAHLAALFVDSPVPRAAVHGDSILGSASLSVAHAADADLAEGTCTLTFPAACVPPCAPPTLVDAGRLHVTGGAGVERVELAFQAAQRTYQPVEPLPPGTPLFRGGEPLRVDGDGAVAPAFHGTVDAPEPLELLAPSALRLGDDALELRWAPARSTRIAIALVASTRDGRWAMIACTAGDAAGHLSIPAPLLAGLPAPPRDLQLEVSRDVIVHAPTDLPGTGVIVHASHAVKRDGYEPR